MNSRCEQTAFKHGRSLLKGRWMDVDAAFIVCLWIVLAIAVPTRALNAGEKSRLDVPTRWSFRLPHAETRVTVPLHRAGGQILVRARLNDGPEGWFTIDTGATMTVVDKGLADQLKLPAMPARRVQFNVNAIDAACGRFDRLVIGSAEVRTGIAVIIDLSAASRAAGIQLSGAIGADLLTSSPICLDLETQKFTIYDPDRFQPPLAEGVTQFPIDYFFGRMAVRGNVEGFEGWFMLDTGGESDPQLYGDFTLMTRVWFGHELMPTSITDATGAHDFFRAKYASFSTLGRKWNNTYVVYSTSDSGQVLGDRLLAGVIGTQQLGRGTLTIDSRHGRCWVHWPSEETTLEMLKRLGPPAAGDLIGRTPLMHAAEGNRIDVVRALVKSGADVNAISHRNETPLSLAAGAGSAEVVRFLIEHGVDLDHATGSLNRSILSDAIASGDASTVSALLGAGVTTRSADPLGNTPLILAARSNRGDVIEALLSAGANIEATNNDGVTALMEAAKVGGPAAVEVLLKHNAKLETKDKFGQTALILAPWAGRADCVQVLLDHGADINATTKAGETALMVAARWPHTEAFHLLLERGADATRVMSDGKNAADFAVANPAVEVLEELMSRGIDPHSK